MNKIKRLSLSICILVLLMICFAGLLEIFASITQTKTHAAETIFSDADYTDDDRLLLKNGTNQDKIISEFAEEVIQASPDDPLYELPEVLPRDFLETSLINFDQ